MSENNGYFGPFFVTPAYPAAYFNAYFAAGEAWEPPQPGIIAEQRDFVPTFMGATVRPGENRLIKFKVAVKVTLVAGGGAAYYTTDSTVPRVYFEAIRYRETFEVIESLTLLALFVVNGQTIGSTVVFVREDRPPA